MQNHFELFKLPEQFSIDREVLDSAYREIQNRVHPDRFVNASDSDKRTALQYASATNDAYQILRNPLKRAAYLCALKGFPLDSQAVPAMPTDFIFEQIEWRERLDQARVEKDMALLEELDMHCRERSREQMQLIEDRINENDFASAIQEVKKMMFLEKFGDEISHVFDGLDTTS